MKSKELIYKRLNREQNTDLGCWKGKEKTEFNCNFWLRKLRRPLSSPDLKYRFSKYVYKYTHRVIYYNMNLILLDKKDRPQGWK